MKKVAIVTDSNSGISKEEAQKSGIFVVPMPFIIDGEEFFEGENLTADEFYKKQIGGAKISTSQPNINNIVEIWKGILKDYDEIVHIPMSSGLSQSCETAMSFAQDFNGRVQVVDNQRISVTLKASVYEAVKLAKDGASAEEIKKYLEDTKAQSSIYIMVDTLKYLKKGGRVTPAAATIATVLNIKPILQIHGQKLDAFAKALSIKSAKQKMIDAIKKDFATHFANLVKEGKMKLAVAHTQNYQNALAFAEEIKKAIPDVEIVYIDALSLSVATHIGPKSLAIACFVSKN